MSAECDKCGFDLDLNLHCVLCEQDKEMELLRKVAKAARDLLEQRGFYTDLAKALAQLDEARRG
jgi:hypothetical protein